MKSSFRVTFWQPLVGPLISSYTIWPPISLAIVLHQVFHHCASHSKRNHTCQAAHSPVLSLAVHSQPAYNGPPVILLLRRGIYQSCFMITMIAVPKDSAFQLFMMATTGARASNVNDAIWLVLLNSSPFILKPINYSELSQGTRLRRPYFFPSCLIDLTKPWCQSWSKRS